MLNYIDWAIIITYLLAMVYIGIRYGKKETLSGFYVNDRKTSRWKLVFSLVATSVGMITIVGGVLKLTERESLLRLLDFLLF